MIDEVGTLPMPADVAATRRSSHAASPPLSRQRRSLDPSAQVWEARRLQPKLDAGDRVRR
jgi:hypothetical protein